MTKKEKIKMLELELETNHRIIDELKRDKRELTDIATDHNNAIADLKAALRKFEVLNNATPENCKRGEWCKACEFAKEIRVPVGSFGYKTEYFCGKNEACSNFVQKEF